MTRLSRLFAASILLLFTNVTAVIADEDRGPAVGSAIPHDLSAVDHSGERQNFNTVKGEKGAVVVFYRSADWCPYCKKQLLNLNKIAEDVAKNGYNLVAISYDKTKTLAKFKAKRKISYTLLSDEGSKIIDAFGIRNAEYKEGHFAHGVPHPIVFVVNADGVIEQKFFKESYANRPENAVILEAVSAD